MASLNANTPAKRFFERFAVVALCSEDGRAKAVAYKRHFSRHLMKSDFGTENRVKQQEFQRGFDGVAAGL